MRHCPAFSVLALILTVTVNAGDWPQILGPNRDGIAESEKLLANWPEDGPKQIWSKDVGQGFAGVAVAKDALILFHRQGNQEIVERLNALTGESIWSSPAACDYRSGMSSDSGPRCVPLISDGNVYTFGANGILRCINLKSGKQIWRRDTWEDFGAPEGYFGAGSTPIVVDGKVVVNVGGRDNAAVVAFSTTDGSTVWQNVDDTASYSSPILTNVSGEQHLIFVTRLKTVSFNPADGSIRFEFPFGARGPTVNGATPVVINDSVFVSASYRVGSVLAAIGNTEVQPKSTGESLLATQYATPIRFHDVLFAVDGRQDSGTATLCCFDPASETMLWRKSGFNYGTLLLVKEDILFLTCEGELIRFPANTLGYNEISRHQVLKPAPGGYRLPALSNGRLYVRDNDRLKCLLVGETQ